MTPRTIALSASLLLIATGPTAGERLKQTDRLATLGAVSVTVADLDALVAEAPPEVRPEFGRSPTLIGNSMTNLLLRRALAADLRSPGEPTVDDAQAIAAVAETTVLANAWLRHRLAAYPEPDLRAEARAYYEAHPAEFTRPRSVDVRHILFSRDAHGDAAARARAEETLALLRQDPTRFEALLAERSDDPRKDQDRGFIRGVDGSRVEQSFAQAALAQETGAIGGVVETSYGFHILRVEAEHPPRPIPFAAVQEELVTGLRAEQRRELTAALLAEMDGDEKAMAREARRLGLDADPVVQARIRQATDEALIRAFKPRYLAGRVPEDLGPLMREHYLTHRSEYTESDRASFEVRALRRDALEDGQLAALSRSFESYLAGPETGPEAFAASAFAGLEVERVVREDVALEDINPQIAARVRALAPARPTGSIEVIDEAVLLIWVTEFTPPRRASFEEVEERLRADLRADLEKTHWEQFLASYHKLPLDADAGRIALLRERYAAALPGTGLADDLGR